ncbi:MAG: hypothetical protein ACXVH7_09335, partial [Thermoanaerobaculia bacterium]
SWAANERMRHVPPVGWMLQKFDVDLRRRVDLLLAPITALPPDDSHRAAIEAVLRSLCRALDRVAEVARQGRGGGNGHPPQELIARLHWALEQAVNCLRGVDAELVGRRYPLQTFERSKAEPLYAALLLVIDALDRLTSIVRLLDARIDERLYETLVNLERPLDSRPMA